MRDTNEPRVLTPGFRLLLDIIASAIGAGLAYSMLASEGFPGVYGVDLMYSLVLASVGLLSGVWTPLILVSSLPAGLISGVVGGSWVLVHLVLAARIVRLVWDVRVLLHGMSRLGRFIDTLLIQAGILAFVALVGGAFSLYMVEHGRSVDDLWEAFWLALVTITTVGYGDVVPETGAGRMVASLLMLVGIGLFTFFLSSLASGISRIAMLDEEPLSALDRKKRIIIEMIKNIEELSEDEYRRLKNSLDLLYILARAGDRPLEELKKAVAE